MSESLPLPPKKITVRLDLFKHLVIAAVFVLLLWLLRLLLWFVLSIQASEYLEKGELNRSAETDRQASEIMSVLPYPECFTLSLKRLSNIYSSRRQFERAESYHAKLLEFDKKQWGASSAQYAEDLSGIALIRRKQRRFDESIGLYRQSISILHACRGKEVSRARLQPLLAWVLIQKNDLDEALELISESDEILKKEFGEISFERLVGLIERAHVLRLTGDARFKQELDFAYRLITVPGDLENSSAQTVVVINLLAQILEQTGDDERALHAFAIAEKNCETSVFGGGYNLFLVDILSPHAKLLEKLGRVREADALRQRAQQVKELKLSI